MTVSSGLLRIVSVVVVASLTVVPCFHASYAADAAEMFVMASDVNDVRWEESEPSVSLLTLFSPPRRRDLAHPHRSLTRLDVFLDELDECRNGDDNTFGPCNVTRFPNCTELSLQQGQELYPCYNRKPHRNLFWPDHVPRYYIEYDRVFCFSTNTICSSCSPGRLCKSEKRCILDELKYNCSQWF